MEGILIGKQIDKITLYMFVSHFYIERAQNTKKYFHSNCFHGIITGLEKA